MVTQCPLEPAWAVPAAAARSDLTVHVLSGTVTNGEGEVALSRVLREVIVALALYRRIAPETLAELVWPEIGQEASRNRLKVSVHRMRRRAAANLIEFRGDHYRLADGVVVDIDSAAARLAGEPPSAARHFARRLRTMRPLGSDDWRWFQPHALRLWTLGHDFAVRAGQRALRDGDPELALSIADELSSEDACDEDAQELVLRAHLLRGEHGEALRSYRRFADALVEELGVKPSASVYQCAQVAAAGIGRPALRTGA